jgi:16S rRNA processing protein RimM
LVGHVVNVIPAGNDLLEVKCVESEANKTKTVIVWIPFVQAILPVVDLQQKRIEIPPTGLIK